LKKSLNIRIKNGFSPKGSVLKKSKNRMKIKKKYTAIKKIFNKERSDVLPFRKK
jgi:hypothetical protein